MKLQEEHINDFFLFDEIKQGNQRAFKFLFDRYFIPISRFIFLYIKDTSTVEEIALDTFTILWEKREAIELKTSIRSYLFQTAKNRSLNYIRDNRRQITIYNEILIEPSEEDSSIELQELENLLEEAICSLPNKCQDVFRKSYSENKSHKEIASELDVTNKAVEAHITKALKRIKAHLNKYYLLFF